MGTGQGAVEDFLTPSPAFWQGKRVFLTGQTGFKGTWLALWLVRLGALVRGFALPEQALSGGQRALHHEAGVARCTESLQGDIRDQDALMQAMRGFAPDIVLHLAAQPLVRLSYREPVDTFATNVMGTVHVLEAVRACSSVRAVVVVTTDKCYENREQIWAYRENEPLGGKDPYSASKAGAELVVGAWRASFLEAAKVAVASARAGNVIGGGDWARDRLVPDCIRALAAGRSIEIRNPRATRPWQHVLEPLAGYLILAERLWQDGRHVAEAWNFGPAMADVKPVAHVVDRVTRLWGPEARWHVAEEAGGPHEAGLLAVDPAKAQARLGWHPRLRLDTALDWTVMWYRDELAGARAGDLILRDIARFEAQGKAYS
jgi:CDP-glucose 4,6-dehydratase